MKTIPVYNTEHEAVVDDEDFDRLYVFRYHVMSGYPHRSIYRSTCGAFLHHDVAGWNPHTEIHHKDGNKFNNQKSNLLVVTKAQHNQLAHRGKSGYIGVYWSSRHKSWCAQLRSNRKCKTVGYFKNIVDAAKARDVEAIRAFGAEAILNFPLFEVRYPQTQTVEPSN